MVSFQFFLHYGPDFTFDINPGNRKDYNTFEELSIIFSVITSNKIDKSILFINININIFYFIAFR